MATGATKRGRRTKLTPEVRDKITSAIRAGNYAHVAAEYAGICAATFYRWLQLGREQESGIYRDFLDAVKQAEREAEVRAVAIVQRHMQDHWAAAMTYLERKFPSRWGRRDRVTVEVNPQETLAALLSIQPDQLESAVDVAALMTDGTVDAAD